MKPKAFNFYLNYIENIETLTDEEVGQLLRALLEYANTGTPPEMSAIVRTAFIPIRRQIDVEFENYELKSKVNSENIRKRWEKERRRKDTNAYEDDTNEYERIRSYEKEKEKEKEEEIKKKKLNKKEKAERFNAFWEAFPKKKNKAMALKAFERLNVDDELLSKMLKALEEHARSREWSDAQYIPYPSTWLNQERWTDVLTPADFTPPNKKSRGLQRDGPGDDMMKIGLGYVEE